MTSRRPPVPYLLSRLNTSAVAMKHESRATHRKSMAEAGNQPPSPDVQSEPTFSLEGKRGHHLRRSRGAVVGAFLGLVAVGLIVYLISRCGIHLTSQRLAGSSGRALAGAGAEGSGGSTIGACSTNNSEENVRSEQRTQSTGLNTEGEEGTATATASWLGIGNVNQDYLYTFPRIDGAEQHSSLKEVMQFIYHGRTLRPRKHTKCFTFISQDEMLVTVEVSELKKSFGHPTRTESSQVGLFLEELILTTINDVHEKHEEGYSSRKAEVVELKEKESEKLCSSFDIRITATRMPKVAMLTTATGSTAVGRSESTLRHTVRKIFSFTGRNVKSGQFGSMPSLHSTGTKGGGRSSAVPPIKSQSVDNLDDSPSTSRESLLSLAPHSRQAPRQHQLLFNSFDADTKRVMMTLMMDAMAMRKESYSLKVTRGIATEGIDMTLILERLIHCPSWPSDADVIDLARKFEESILQLLGKFRESRGYATTKVAHVDIHKNETYKGRTRVVGQIVGSILATRVSDPSKILSRSTYAGGDGSPPPGEPRSESRDRGGSRGASGDVSHQTQVSELVEYESTV